MDFSLSGNYISRIKGAARDRSVRLVSAMGIDLHMKTDDRRILEDVILPYYAGKREYYKLIFVGCEWYTKGYNKIFANHEYWTLDSNSYKERYGSRLHIEDKLENITAHFREDELDLIICNGVFGWGLNQPAMIEQAFSGCLKCLRPGGHFILGWNDVPEHLPLPIEGVQALKLFEPYRFPPLSNHRFLTANPNRHIYNFYRKHLPAQAR